MEPITLQKIFDLAWQKFIVEDALPAAKYYECSYLLPDGRKCAVGLALPEYHPAQEFFGDFGDLAHRQHPELFDKRILTMPIEDLNYFQKALHDDLAGVDADNNAFWLKSLEERKEAYRKVAKKFNLSTPGKNNG